MPRGADTWPTIGGALSRVLSLPAPLWVTPRTATLVADALASLRSDALAAMAGVTTREAPGRLGMGRTALMEALAPGGWLSPVGPGATLAEVFDSQDRRQR